MSRSIKVFVLLSTLFLAVGPALAERLALIGATIHPVSSEPIANGYLLISQGRIEALGPLADLDDSVTTLDLGGQHLYPGLVHAGTVLGLTEIGSVAGTDDTTEMGSINAAIRAEIAVNHDSMLFAPNISGGLLSVNVMPTGGLIRGTSAVISLSGWNWQDMTLHAPSGMHIAFPAAAADDPEHADLKLINETLEQARAWQRAVQAHEKSGAPQPAPNEQFAALVPLLDGQMRLFLHANGEQVMRAALDWAEAQEFDQLVLVGNSDLQHLATRLAADDVPAILGGVLTMPERSWEPYDQAYAAAARLAEAGVRFAITDGGGAFVAGNARHIAFEAGMAAAFGLPVEAALKSITQWPAEIIGAGDELGTLEPGKRASFFVASGSPLEATTRIERAWIDGEEYDFSRDRQRQLYQRYRNRPRPTAAD